MISVSPPPVTPGQIYEFTQTGRNRFLFVSFGSISLTLVGLVVGLVLTWLPQWVGGCFSVIALALIFLAWKSVLADDFGSFHWVSALWITFGCVACWSRSGCRPEQRRG